jgi:hypothetical protein
MSHLASKYRILIFALLTTLASCSKPGSPPAEKAARKTFASSSEAAAALLAAAQSAIELRCSQSSAPMEGTSYSQETRRKIGLICGLC